MITHGPFFPSVLANLHYQEGETPWSIGGGTAQATVPVEGVTAFLSATGFKDASGNPIQLPENAVVKEVRMDTGVIDGQNNSEQFLVGPLEAQAWTAPPYIRVESDNDPGLTRDVVNDPAFGFKFAMYAMSGGLIHAGSMMLYIDTE